MMAQIASVFSSKHHVGRVMNRFITRRRRHAGALELSSARKPKFVSAARSQQRASLVSPNVDALGSGNGGGAAPARSSRASVEATLNALTARVRSLNPPLASSIEARVRQRLGLPPPSFDAAGAGGVGEARPRGDGSAPAPLPPAPVASAARIARMRVRRARAKRRRGPPKPRRAAPAHATACDISGGQRDTSGTPAQLPACDAAATAPAPGSRDGASSCDDADGPRRKRRRQVDRNATAATSAAAGMAGAATGSSASVCRSQSMCHMSATGVTQPC